MKRRSVVKAFDPIRPDAAARERMLKNILSSEISPAGKDERMMRKKMKPFIIAAIIGLMIVLMGCAVVIRTVLAESDLFEYPLVNSSEVPLENIILSTSYVSATSMRVQCRIEGVEYGVNSIYTLANGPFVIEKLTDDGWKSMISNIDDDNWRPDAVLTSGSTDWYVDWSGMYGILEPGIYRYVATVLEGNVPVSVEFEITDESDGDLQDELRRILDGDAYHIRYEDRIEFGSTENLTQDGLDFVEHESATYTYDFVKSGNDMLNLCYRDGILWSGIMYRDGIKYQIDHVDDDRTMPVIGWSPWPGMDLNDLSGWVHTLNRYIDECELIYDENGEIMFIAYTHSSDTFNSYKVENTVYRTWEIVSTDMEHAAEMIAEQDIDVAREFSWDEDQRKYKSLQVEYANIVPEPITKASEAIQRAMAECTVEHDKILVYRDEGSGMWKVEFQIMFGYQGYQYVYLDDNGITQMVSGAGSKVPEWKELYPDP